MKVSKIMSPAPIHTCHGNATLSAASRLLWEHDCGILPVVDSEERVVGTITDRDICMAALSTNRPLSELPVHHAMASDVFSCKPSDEVVHALQIMQDQQVRRLPVLDGEERLVGMLSISDLAREVRGGRALSPARLTEALAAISRPRAEEAPVPKLVNA